MKKQKTTRLISIVAYLLIILMGQIIGMPFFLWLLFTLFDFGNTDQLFAFIGVVGLTVIFINQNKVRNLKIFILDIVSFLLLASPIVRRMTAISIEQFNYLAFIIPTMTFVVFYIISIYFSGKQYLQNRPSAND